MLRHLVGARIPTCVRKLRRDERAEEGPMPTTTDEIAGEAHLRPIERTVLKLTRGGKTEADIAWRLRRSPGHVRRTLALARIPREAQPEAGRERGISADRADGAPQPRSRVSRKREIAARLRRSPAFVQRVGVFADYKLAQASRGRA